MSKIFNIWWFLCLSIHGIKEHVHRDTMTHSFLSRTATCDKLSNKYSKLSRFIKPDTKRHFFRNIFLPLSLQAMHSPSLAFALFLLFAFSSISSAEARRSRNDGKGALSDDEPDPQRQKRRECDWDALSRDRFRWKMTMFGFQCCSSSKLWRSR